MSSLLYWKEASLSDAHSVSSVMGNEITQWQTEMNSCVFQWRPRGGIELVPQALRHPVDASCSKGSTSFLS